MPLLDPEEASWLAALIAQAVIDLKHGPCITVEVDGEEKLWVQILPRESETEPGKIDSFLLNFPYRYQTGDPMTLLVEQGLRPPPGSETAEFESGHFAALLIRGDVPLLGLAHFSGEILETVVGAGGDAELAVRVEYGYQS